MHEAGKGSGPLAFLPQLGEGWRIKRYRKDDVIFWQGAAADAVFFIQSGRVQVTVVSDHGKEAVVAFLDEGEFFGEGCLVGQKMRTASARAFTESNVVRVDRLVMIRALQERPEFAQLFMTHLLSRNIRIEEDLVDQYFNSSEKRLARALLLLANFGKERPLEPIDPKITQKTLAEMVGTTRSRVSFFLNRFRKLGFIEYNGGIHVHSELLNVILSD